MNSTDYEDSIFLLHLARSVSPKQTLARRNLTRLQRASKGSDQSTYGRCHDVIERRRMRLKVRGSAFEIVLCDGSVDAEGHRLLFGRQVRAAEGPLNSFNAYL